MPPLDGELRNIPDFVGRIGSYSVAEGYNLDQLYNFMKRTYIPLLKQEALCFTTQNGGDVVFFCYGVVVFWGMSEAEEKDFLSQAEDFRVAPIQVIESDHFEYTYAEKKGVAMDRIQLEVKDRILKVAISHAVAQSVKLSNFENNIEDLISKTKYLPLELAVEGKISLTRKKLSQKMGELFIEKNKVFLQSSILDKPDLLWEFQQYDEMYLIISAYLDIKLRTKILHIKFGVVQEMFDMLRSESEARSSERQEWIVIILIFIELIFLILETASSFIVEWYKS